MRNSMHINIPNLSELFCDPFPKSFCTLCLSMLVRSIFFNFRNISFFTNRFITFYLYDHINVNQQQVHDLIKKKTQQKYLPPPFPLKKKLKSEYNNHALL